MTDDRQHGVWYPDDVEKQANTDRELGIPEVSDTRLIAEEVITAIIGIGAVLVIVIWLSL